MPQSGTLLVLPRPLQVDGNKFITAPSESEFTSRFGDFHPAVQFLPSAYGTTAYYDLPPSTSSRDVLPQRLIFVHGVGTPAVGLTPLARKLQALNPGLHILLYDLWGHGLSQTPLVPHVPALFHAQILHLLSHMKWPSAHVVGYSFGGSTATSFTAFHPEVVDSLAIIAPVGLLRSEDLTEKERSFLRGGPDVEEAARDWVLDFTEGGELVVPQDWKERVNRGELVVEAIRSWEREEHKGHVASVVAMGRDGNIFDGHDAYRTVAKGEKKTLAVLGELDDVCTTQDLNAVGWENVLVVKGANHGLVRNRVDEVAAPLHDFLTRLA
ncbi:valacyclovir hydrolase [Xylogone sp. PMI_703]|nr:valacyclovir hydrolase [Xylogone sp. PMI_703]